MTYAIDYTRFNIGKRFFTGEGHNRMGWYSVNGQDLINVTTALDIKAKPGLANWKVKMALEKQDKDAGDIEAKIAANRGTRLHRYFEWDLKGSGEKPALKPEDMPFLDGWKNFRNEHTVRFVASEMRTCHLRHGYAGTTDLVAYVDDVPCIGDYKTVGDPGKLVWPPYETQRFQLEAYRRAWHWMGGGWLDGVCLIRISTKGKYDLRLWNSRKDMDEADDSFRGFLDALGLFKSCNKFKQRNPLPSWSK